ncbi:MAG: hypothetical protein R2705_03135 [Ilumatobacteraceae bacterium]
MPLDEFQGGEGQLVPGQAGDGQGAVLDGVGGWAAWRSSMVASGNSLRECRISFWDQDAPPADAEDGESRAEWPMCVRNPHRLIELTEKYSAS